MRTIKATAGMIIPIGYLGENLATEVIFKLPALEDTYGVGSARLFIQNPVDETYAVELTISEGYAHWAVRNVDVAHVGIGKAELHWYGADGETIAKPIRYGIRINDALGYSGEIPDPIIMWLDDVGQRIDTQITKIDGFTESAKAYAEDARQSAEAAQQSADETEAKLPEIREAIEELSQRGTYVTQTTEPEDTNVLWVDPSDTAEEDIASKVYVNAKVAEVAEDLEDTKTQLAEKATLYKLYFDGDNIFRSEEDWEEYIPMTFDEVYDLCYDEKNFVYIGDGQMKYYPQLDLHVQTKPHSIEFMSSAQLDGKNLHTRIIITEDNLVKTDQIIDTPYFEFSAAKSQLSESIVDISERTTKIDGKLIPNKELFDIGNISISSSGWGYSSINSRVRTKNGATIHLKKGSTISLKDYSDARMYLGWRLGDGTYKYRGWITNGTEVVAEDADYVILLCNLKDTQQTDINALYNLLSIEAHESIYVDLRNQDSRIARNTFLLRKAEYSDILAYKADDWVNMFYEGSVSKWVASANRLSLTAPIFMERDAHITWDYSTYEVNAIQYNADGTMASSTGWINSEIAISSGQSITITARRIDGGNITPSEGINFSCSYTSEKTIRHNPNYLSVAHQGYAPTGESTGRNRLSAYVKASERGFDAGECDIQFSSDGVAVCCHDATFTDNKSGNIITIADKTIEQLKSYGYYGEQIATFSEVVEVCKKNGLKLFIDKFSDWFSDSQKKDAIFNAVRKCKMEDNVLWLAPNTSIANEILAWYDKSAISMIYCDVSAVQYVKERSKGYVGLSTSSVSLESLTESLPLGCGIDLWTIDDVEAYKNYMPFVHSITSNKICYNDVVE